ncbi:MAG: DinB family protein [Actinobacteria bacterium]|nr:DinB family protein [Actinomycetota bacterium]MBU1866223.1 DinB family protein [Actinomycetota bacterium]
MIDPRWLARQFERNTWILTEQTAGLSHGDSLLQTPYRINCLNWTLGHLLDGRGRVLELLGATRVVADSDTARYRRESEPIVEDGPGVLPLDRLVAALKESQASLSAALARLDTAAMAVETDDRAGHLVPLGEQLHFLYFHDTYHTGQTELLRQVFGVGDKII